MRRVLLIVVVASGLFLSLPVVLDSCGMGPPVPTFVAEKRPVDVNGQFLAGRLGVVRRSWEPRYMIGAYRMLSGKPLTAEEITALYAAPREVQTGSPSGLASWDALRHMMAPNHGAGLLVIDPYKSMGAGTYNSFLNCNDDAFETATATLRLLKQEWGETDGRVLSWMLAQHQVFANCSSLEPTIPDAPGPAMDPELASHRRYQIAAARFYAGQYREAADAFLKIADERESTWWSLGRYLAARALARAGEFSEDAKRSNQAKALLESCLKNPALEQWHAASRDLLARLKLQIEPDARMKELSAVLMGGGDDEFRQAAIDFAFLLHRTLDRRGRPFPQSHYAQLEAASDLSAWVMTMSNLEQPASGDRAVTRWRTSRNPAWLIAALRSGSDGDLPPLLEAAQRVAPPSPAFESVSYYALLREARLGRKQQARAWADHALSQRGLVVSARNLILAERTKLALNWDEVLTYGLRRVERAPTKSDDVFDLFELPDGAIYTFDSDVITVFNSEVPLRLWLNAITNRALPAYLRLRVAQSGWFRAVMLGRYPEAKQFLARVVELNPRAAAAKDFLSATEAGQMHFAAVCLFLKAPGLSPHLRDAWVENENLAMPHVSRQCPFPLGETPQQFPDFLNAADRKAAADEGRALKTNPPWFATETLRSVLDWGDRHPEDGRVPEALHRAVQMSRYGCGDENTGKYSQQAFQMLHAKYAGTSWATETKYWYK